MNNFLVIICLEYRMYDIGKKMYNHFVETKKKFLCIDLFKSAIKKIC